jgi:uncharacterized glyoxalase superfamily protein PhnB
MNIQYKSVLLFVEDISTSRHFYENVLRQKVQYDFGEDVVFEGGFTIHDSNHFSRLLFNRPNPHVKALGQENLELYFESDELDEVFTRLVNYGVTFIHPIKEQPWGQRVFRFYDPDSHIVEIGEPMSNVITRYLKNGVPAEEVARRTFMPLEEVRKTKNMIQF